MPSRGIPGADRSGLTLELDHAGARAPAYAAFLRDVFDLAVPPPTLKPTWQPLGYYDAAESCVASLEIGDLTLATAESLHQAAGIRLVGVTEGWRGHGLFRALMEHALDACAARGIDLIMLFAEELELYRRFGFEPVPQHAFVGPPPVPVAAAPARALDALSGDARLVERLLASRTPVSGQIALVDAPSLFLAKVEDGGDLSTMYLPDADALVVHEVDGDTLVVVDIVVTRMPSLAQVLGALPVRCERVRTLFPPDRLDWNAARPVPEETGLMARGPLPAAMRRPFILPPTAEF